MSNKKRIYFPNCPNCNHALVENDNFCPNCGQKPTDGKVSMHDLLHDLFHMLFHLDSKFFRTLKHLFIPGKLTQDFFSGKQKSYAPPIQLYLVLGSLFLFCTFKFTHRGEELLQKELEENQSIINQKKLLLSLDSVAKNSYGYNHSPIVKANIDSLLKVQYLKLGAKSLPTTINNYKKTSQELAVLALTQAGLETKRAETAHALTAAKLAARIELVTQQIQMAQIDSINQVTNISLVTNKSLDQAAKALEKSKYDDKELIMSQGAWEISYESGQDNALPQDSLRKQQQQKAERKSKAEIAEHLEELDDMSPNIDSFLAANRVLLENYKGENSYKDDSALEQDSVHLNGIKLSSKDIMELPFEEINNKYKLHEKSFFTQRMVKSGIKFRKEGGNMLHAFISKSIWILLAALVPTAGALWLLYRRQKRYFVEHFVLLLHLNCLTFICFPIFFLGPYIGEDWAAIIFALIVLVAPFFAMKMYYQQSWRKTFAKYIIFSLAYLMIGIAIMGASIVAGALFL